MLEVRRMQSSAAIAVDGRTASRRVPEIRMRSTKRAVGRPTSCRRLLHTFLNESGPSLCHLLPEHLHGRRIIMDELRTVPNSSQTLVAFFCRSRIGLSSLDDPYHVYGLRVSARTGANACGFRLAVSDGIAGAESDLGASTTAAVF